MKQIFQFAISICLFMVLASPTVAADYRVEKIDDGPSADDLSEEISAALADSGYQVIRGKKRSIGKIWLCKELPVAADFVATDEVLYPFTPGQLIGVIQFKRKSPDFRDHILTRGTYILRYGQQPVDGNHEGTSPTRDFLMLTRAEDDRTLAGPDAKTLIAQSADAAGSNHPAMLCLQAASEADEVPSLRHDEDREWSILQLEGQAKADGESQPIRIDIVVVGQAAE